MRSTVEGIVLLLIGGFAAWGAWLVPAPPAGETWAGVLPLGAAVLLAASGGLLVWSGRGGEASAGVALSAGQVRVLGLIAVAVLYYAAINRFGYELPTAVAAPLALWLFGMRRPVGLGLAAVLCPAAFHLIFFQGLGVFPPYGEVFDLMDWLRS